MQNRFSSPIMKIASAFAVCAGLSGVVSADTLITYKTYVDTAAYIDGAYDENLGGVSTVKNVVTGDAPSVRAASPRARAARA